MQLAAQVFSFGEPGATGRSLAEWMVWSMGLAMVVAWVPPRSFRLDPLAHVALVAMCLSIAVLSGFLHVTSYFQRIDVTKEGDLTIGYDDPKYREEVLPAGQIDAIEVGTKKEARGEPFMCRLIVISNGAKRSSLEDDCHAVERARRVLTSAMVQTASR